MATAGAHLLYGLYGWLLFAMIAPPTWLLTARAPKPAAAWRVNRLAARIILRLAGIALAVRGVEHLPRMPTVLVANHASYLDGMALFATLPAHFSFVAKRGTRAMLRAGQWLPRHGAIAVTIGSPMFPPSPEPDAFAAAVALRDMARAHILAHCGEPDAGSG